MHNFATEPAEELDDLGTFDLPDHDHDDELLTFNLTPKQADGNAQKSFRFKF